MSISTICHWTMLRTPIKIQILIALRIWTTILAISRIIIIQSIPWWETFLWITHQYLFQPAVLTSSNSIIWHSWLRSIVIITITTIAILTNSIICNSLRISTLTTTLFNCHNSHNNHYKLSNNHYLLLFCQLRIVISLKIKISCCKFSSRSKPNNNNSKCKIPFSNSFYFKVLCSLHQLLLSSSNHNSISHSNHSRKQPTTITH